MKKIVGHIGVFWIGLAYLGAAWGADPFGKAEDKGSDIVDFLTGNLALVFATAVIAIAAFALMIGRLSSQWALKIIGGAVILGAAGEFASWAIK